MYMCVCARVRARVVCVNVFPSCEITSKTKMIVTEAWVVSEIWLG